MRSRIIPVVVGALVMLTLGAISLVVLWARYQGNIPLVPPLVAALVCSLIGGYLATRLAQVRGLTIGGFSGLVAGLISLALATLLVGAVTVLAGLLITVTLVTSGALGPWLTQVRLSLERAVVERLC